MRLPRRPRPHLREVSTLHAPACEEPPVLSPTSLSLSVPLPPSINHQYATVNARRVLSAKGRAYKDVVGKRVLMALAGSPHRETLLRTLRGRHLELSLRFYFAAPTRRDVDGGLKITQDSVCEAIGLNDNRVHEIHLYKDHDPLHPRVLVRLSALPPRGQALRSPTPGATTARSS